jgi:hypothetical protein
VAVSSSLLAQPHCASQFWENRFKGSDYGFQSFGFRAHAQECLFEVQVKRQGRRQVEGNRTIEIFGKLVTRSRESHNFTMEF